MENKYYLAVEVKPKNYFPIDLLNLKIANSFTSTNLEELDGFRRRIDKYKSIIGSTQDYSFFDNFFEFTFYFSIFRKSHINMIFFFWSFLFL